MLLDKKLIKELRTDKGWTQQHLAELSDLNIRTIQRIEKDGIASMETSMSLASIFQISISSLYIKNINDVSKFSYIVIFLFGAFVGILISYITSL
jgi:DNA-binding XRE family transcriptional regulator